MEINQYIPGKINHRITRNPGIFYSLPLKLNSQWIEK